MRFLRSFSLFLLILSTSETQDTKGCSNEKVQNDIVDITGLLWSDKKKELFRIWTTFLNLGINFWKYSNREAFKIIKKQKLFVDWESVWNSITFFSLKPYLLLLFKLFIVNTLKVLIHVTFNSQVNLRIIQSSQRLVGISQSNQSLVFYLFWRALHPALYPPSVGPESWISTENRENAT